MGYFPQSYVAGLCEFLARNRHRIDVITYRDIQWQSDYDAPNKYPTEFEAYKQRRESMEARGKCEVLLQHDVDGKPRNTLDVLEIEHTWGLTSTSMMFNRLLNRSLLRTKGRIEYVPESKYPIDESEWERFRLAGFEIGLHVDSMERTFWNPADALALFTDDLAEMRSRHPVNFFSAHGGVRGPDQINNNSMPLPPQEELDARWVHNGYTPKMTKQFSDGGHFGTKIDPAHRDIRDFVKTWVPGGRYRILIHPQYYSDSPEASESYGGTPWYDALLASSGNGWERIELPW